MSGGGSGGGSVDFGIGGGLALLSCILISCHRSQDALQVWGAHDFT